MSRAPQAISSARRRRVLAQAAVLLVALTAAGRAAADTDLFGRDTISGLLDLRVIGADGEDSYLRGGLGKTEASGAGAGVAVRPTLELATAAWRPQLADDLDAYVTVQNQPHQTHPFDLGEAFLQYRPVPHSSLRFGLRAGLMWPPASLEHDGPAWALTRTLTPSAANTWIAEEVKVAGVEGFVSHDFGSQRLTATAAVFGDNDTSGALLAYRGWALSDIRTPLFGSLPTPDGPAAPDDVYQTGASTALDHRPGGYARLEWRPPAPVALQAFVYDNNADPNVHRGPAWTWQTDFADVGLAARPAEGVEVLAQALGGRSYSGPDTRQGWSVEEDFSAAYLLATRVAGPNRFTVRIDEFEVSDRLQGGPAGHDEHGWATTGDYAYALGPNLSLWVEALHVWSRRPERAAFGLPPGQAQNVVQFAIRASI
jgi:hypothetical protein